MSTIRREGEGVYSSTIDDVSCFITEINDGLIGSVVTRHGLVFVRSVQSCSVFDFVFNSKLYTKIENRRGTLRTLVLGAGKFARAVAQQEMV